MRPPLRIALSVSLLLLATSGMAARQDAPARSPRNASYTLQATLDPVNRLIQGRGRLTWRNISQQPATELRFHLYWNAWRDPGSTWLREQALGLLPRLARRPADDRGFIDVGSLRRAGPDSADLLPRAQFIAPDDGNADDRTVLAVPLDRPVAPGESIDVDMTWTSRVPRTYARTGTIGSYFFIAQWFPKIGVLEDTGWNAHQFHAATEFFADFGVYDVSVTVPSGWMLGATGREQSATDNGNGTTTHRYVEADVHDFAWTTSPDFLERRARFEEPGLPPVDLRLLLQPEHHEQADRHFNAARVALKYYGTWFGPYPYRQLTIVDPVTMFNLPAQGEGTRGMEYPTLITAGTRWFAPWVGSEPEAVTVHETGHQFFYGIVATNEFEHAWMDEGINTYATARVLAQGLASNFVTVERYFGGLGAWSYNDSRWSRDIDGNRLNAYRPVASFDVQSTPTWRYWPGTARFATYNKTALWLTTLERMLGWETMQRLLATYYTRGAFRHPAPAEFFAIANEVSGQDLTWFFDAVHRSSASFDYAVAQVTAAPHIPGDDTGSATIDTTVVVRRLGDGVFPVDVRVTFDDETTGTVRWDGRDPWHAFTFRRGSAVRTVEVDPDRVLTLDLNYTNNSWTSRPRAAEASTRWALRWLTWAQDLLLTYAFFS